MCYQDVPGGADRDSQGRRQVLWGVVAGQTGSTYHTGHYIATKESLGRPNQETVAGPTHRAQD